MGLLYLYLYIQLCPHHFLLINTNSLFYGPNI